MPLFIKLKIMCFLNKHEKIYWTDKKCKDQNVMTGLFRPWFCMHCDYKSNIFKLPVKKLKLSEKEKLKIRIKKLVPGVHVLINFNDEMGEDLYSVEPKNDVGNWIYSFNDLESAEKFIKKNNFKYNRKTDLRNGKYPSPWPWSE